MQLYHKKNYKYFLSFCSFCFIFMLCSLYFPSVVRADNLLTNDTVISSSDGVVWDRKNQNILINENASIVKNNTNINAKTISIDYTDNENGKSLSKLIATDNVVISSDDKTLKGDKLVYNALDKKAVLTGKKPMLFLNEATITAKVFEYLQIDNQFLAKNNVIINHQKGVINADNAVAYIVNQDNKNNINKIELIGNVVITTEDEVVKSNNATYDIASDTVLASGDIIIEKQNNVIKGDFAEVDLKSGLSKLIAKPSSRVGVSIKNIKK